MKRSLSSRIILLIVVVLIVSNSILCAVSIFYSRSAIRKSIQQRMLDIANCASGSVDGDMLGSLTAEDIGSSKYTQIYDALSVFRDNVELEYVYSIRSEGHGVFIFTIDTDPDTPAAFGDRVEYTDALNTAAHGTGAVDNVPYEDAWGRHYSTYSPVFDSSKNVAGIIGVDFSEDWFNRQLADETLRIMLIFSAVLLGTLILSIFVSFSVVRGITNPLKKMIEVAQKYKEGDFSEKMDVGGSEEITDLSEALSSMADALQDKMAILQSVQVTLSEEVEHKKSENEMLMVQVVQALAGAIDAKDVYTNGHSARVAEYSREIAKRYGYSERKQDEIYVTGLLHDVGKIGVPDEVINKPSRLTDEEFAMIKAHPRLGADILGKIHSMPNLMAGARYHHERYGGGGYPDGISGKDIPELARIIAVADAYDAMSSNRSYRKALPQETVRAEIEKGKGTQFDPEFADIMLTMIDEDTEYDMREKDEEE